MGASESRDDVSEYDFVQKADKNLYGDAKLCKKNGESSQFVLKDRFCEDKSVTESFHRYLDHDLWRSEHFTTINAKIVGSEGQYCGTCATNHKLILVMEFFLRDLAGEITRRQVKMDHYPEGEIWYIIESLVEIEEMIFSYFKSYHGDIKTDSIFVNEEGIIKVLDNYLLDSNQSPYMKQAHGLIKIPQAPEVMSELKIFNGIPQFDKEKSEVWLIGILILNCMSLTHYDKFYNWTEKEVDCQLIETTLYKIGGVYSPLLRDLVEHCLEPNTRKRCTIAAIKQFITIRKQ